MRTGDAEAFGKRIFATAVDPATARSSRSTGSRARTHVLASLGDNGAFVDDGYAKDHHLTVGSPIELTFANGKKKNVRRQGDLRPAGRRLAVRPDHDLRRDLGSLQPNPKNLYSFVKMRGGQTDANLKALEQQLKTFPNAKAATKEKFIDNQISGLNSILNILYVLLALSVVVSLFGIVNTLVLTVFERTRELGMLRAIGMARIQVRRMIRHESVITALIGGVLGILLGIVLGGAAGRARRLHRVHPADRRADRLRDRGDHRRHRRGDLPGAARRPAERARSAAVRVAAAARRGESREPAAAAAGSREARAGLGLVELRGRHVVRRVRMEDGRERLDLAPAVAELPLAAAVQRDFVSAHQS